MWVKWLLIEVAENESLWILLGRRSKLRPEQKSQPLTSSCGRRLKSPPTPPPQKNLNFFQVFQVAQQRFNHIPFGSEDIRMLSMSDPQVMSPNRKPTRRPLQRRCHTFNCLGKFFGGIFWWYLMVYCGVPNAFPCFFCYTCCMFDSLLI